MQQLSNVSLPPLPSAQPTAAGAPLTQLPPSTHTNAAPNATLVAPFAPSFQPVQSVASVEAQVAGRHKGRQASIHPEESIKVESDGLEPSNPTRLIHRSAGTSSLGADEQYVSYHRR